MNALIVFRVLIIIIAVIVIDFIIRLNKTFKIDRRVSRYSIDSIIDDNNSIVELLGKKYNHLIKQINK